MKWIKIIFIKLKWVLFGKKPLKKVFNEINKERGLKIVYRKKFKYNGRKTYASTKRCKMK